MITSNRSSLSRRAVLTALGAFAAAPAMAASPPLAGVRFRAVAVDVAPLRATGADDYADWIAAELPGLLRQSFAARWAPNDRDAATLVARIDEVFLGPTGSASGNPVLDATDGIQGAGITVGPRGQRSAPFPLYCAVGANTYPNMPDQLGITRRRVETLARSFAQWLPGQMGL